jgi:hypothetical protein
MATRWMKWNEGTHIFEYSTDGVTFNPLPLDASILTQGVIDPARLPPGTLTGGSNNVFTGINTLSNVYPRLIFNETDATAGLKNWDIGADGSVFRMRTLDDALALIANIVAINRAGQVYIIPSASGVALDITGAINPNVVMSIRNTEAGTNRVAGILLGNDTIPALGQLTAQSSTFTSFAWTRADAITLLGGGAGGLNLSASHANGEIRFYSGGSATPRLTLQVSGNSVFLGTLTERGRATALGEWLSWTPTWSASGTQPVIGNGSMSGRYTRVGKTVHFEFILSIGSTTTIGTGSYYWNFPLTAAGYGTFVGKYLRSGVAYQACFGIFRDANTFQMVAHGASSQFGATVPFAWAAGDTFQVSGTYSEP